MKAKKFSRKLLALFLAVVMALTCFSGVMTSYAYSKDVNYYDTDVYFNSLGWSVLSDEQAATAVLDFVDGFLAENADSIYDLLASKLSSSGIYYYNSVNRQLVVYVPAIVNINVSLNLNSVDGLLNTVASLESNLRGLDESLVGDASKLHFSATAKMTRSNTSSCDILKAILGLIQQNITYFTGTSDSEDVIGKVLRGEFDLGMLNSAVDVYGIIGNALGLESGYQSNMIYNIVKALLFNYTGWFTEDEIAGYKTSPDTFKLDAVLLEKMTSELLSKININITYPDDTSSKSRYKEMQEYVSQHGGTIQSAATALGYDPKLVYSEENEGNVLLFVYGYGAERQELQIDTNTNLLNFGYQALDIAWKTALSPTIKLIHVNYDNWTNNEHGSNFDNVYYYWASKNTTWDQSNLASNYTAAKLTQWANSTVVNEDETETTVYASYGFDTAQDFLDYVKSTLEFDRSVVENAKGNWRDIDATTLFTKLRYSPLADYAFDIQTGPINLYFMQTGTSNLDAFFEDYAAGEYTSMVGALNNALLAAVRDFFPDRDNIYLDAKGDLNFPALEETTSSINQANGFTTAQMKSLAQQIVRNALKIVQYTADATDRNILANFYKTGTTLSEANLESAMIPFLIACIGQINLGHGKLNVLIHPEDWDSCKDAEGVMFICLQEYLSYILPDRDYEGTFKESGAITTDTSGQINVDFDAVILPMARDALAFILSPLVPISYNGIPWRLSDKVNFDIDSAATVYDLLNSVVCYYADDFTLSGGGKGIGIAALLGLCDNSGESLISTDNTIWENIDIAVNKLLPVGGALQTGSSANEGKADSYDLVYNDLICGIRDIGDTTAHTSGLYGTSNIIYKVLVLVTSEPLSTERLEVTVYNLLADLLNALFGARYTGQTYDKPIPEFDSLSASAQAYPFDNLLQKAVIVGTDSQPEKVGALQKLIFNFVEASGHGRTSSKALDRNAYPDSIMRGLMFVLTSVNSFLDIIPSLSEHEFNMATATLQDTTAYGFDFESQLVTSLTIKNNSEGINIAYIDSNGNPQRTNRYAIYLKNVTCTSNFGKAYVSGFPSSGAAKDSYDIDELKDSLTVDEVIMPSNLKNLTFVSGLEGADDEPTTLTITYTYNVLLIDDQGNVDTSAPIYSDLQGVAYQYLTPATSWKDTVYPADRNGQMAAVYEINTAGGTATNSGFTAKASTAFGTNSSMILNYPQTLVTSTDTLRNLPDLKVRVRNNGSASGSFDGWYTYDNKSVVDDATNSLVAVNSTNAIPVFDENTGALINVDKFDYSTDGGTNWSTNDGAGYTWDEVSAYMSDNTDKDVSYRTHIAYTFAEAQQNNMIAAYHKDGDRFEYIYLKEGSVAYSTLLSKVSMRGPVDGLYLSTYSSSELTVANGAASYYSLLNYQNGASVQAGEYDVNLVLCTGSGKTQVTDMKLIIGDDSAASAVESKYNELSELVANFRRAEDFDDPAVYDYAVTALQDTLKTLAEPLTPNSAKAMNDTKVLKATTALTTATTGDLAYTPCTSAASIPLELRGSVYYNNTTGCYYLDSDYTLPVYTNVPLTAAGVTGGKDRAGMAVVAGSGENASNYYYVNSPAYESKWTTEYGAPYLKETDVQQTNNDGELLYNVVRFKYLDANNNMLDSQADWQVMVPITYTAVKTNDTTDYRGTYTAAIDYLDYAIDNLTDGIKDSVKNKLFNEVSLVRAGMNTNDYEQTSYKAMTSYAQKIEQLYSITLNYTEKNTGNTKTTTVSFNTYYNNYLNNKDITINSEKINCSVSSIQAEQYVQMFNNLITHVTERGYIGSQLEAEIKCASGIAYNDMTAVKPVYDEETGAVITNGTVTLGLAAGTPRFGTRDADGNLINGGAKTYTRESWNNYINALANAVYLANYANSSAYTKYASRLYYVPADKENYIAQVSDVYYNDAALQRAENMLEEYVEKDIVITVADVTGGYVTINGKPYTAPVTVSTSTDVTIQAYTDSGYTFTAFQVGNSYVTENPYTTTFDDDVTITPVYEAGSTPSGNTVSGTIVVAKNNKGETNGIAPYGEYTFTVYSDAARTAEVDTFTSVYDDSGSKAVNAFSMTLPDGVYYATLTSKYSVAREDITITVSGADITDQVIPVMACDFDLDGGATSTDAGKVLSASAGNFADAAYCDLDGDGGATSMDASIVFACSAGSMNFAPINMQ